MKWSVKSVVPKSDYILHLTFEGGEIRIFDMKPYLEIGIFRALKDQKLFNTARVSFNTVEWSNKADIDPEVLYQYSKPIST